jgi:hypothetical protein
MELPGRRRGDRVRALDFLRMLILLRKIEYSGNLLMRPIKGQSRNDLLGEAVLLPMFRLKCTVFEQSKWTPLNVNISNTIESILAGFVAYERKFRWRHFSIKIYWKIL